MMPMRTRSHLPAVAAGWLMGAWVATAWRWVWRHFRPAAERWSGPPFFLPMAATVDARGFDVMRDGDRVAYRCQACYGQHVAIRSGQGHEVLDWPRGFRRRQECGMFVAMVDTPAEEINRLLTLHRMRCPVEGQAMVSAVGEVGRARGRAP